MVNTLLGEDYEYFKAEVLKDPKKPYFMHNEELAEEYFDEFKKENPDIRTFFRDGEQILCMTDQSQRELVRILDKRHEKELERLGKTKKLIKEVEDKNSIWKRR